MTEGYLWTSKNGVWKIAKFGTGMDTKWFIENTKTGYNDNPIVYDYGGIAYDNPYGIPKYVKKQFSKMAFKK